MSVLINSGEKVQALLDHSRHLDFLAPLALRLYLAPVFFSAGLNKALAFDSTVAWFGNADWGLGLPFPWLLALLATVTELVGGIFLLIGFATRWVSVPLMITMLVVIFTVHWGNGWFAIAPSDPATSTARPLAELGLPTGPTSVPGMTWNAQDLVARMATDKKVKDGRLTFILSRGIGKAYVTQDVRVEDLTACIEEAIAA